MTPVKFELVRDQTGSTKTPAPCGAGKNHSMNKVLTDSSLLIRSMVSASSEATET